jgi:glycosyltransferase involved in cell wall biosynthesis
VKVLIFAPAFPGKGGVERHLEKVIGILKSRGHEIIVAVRCQQKRSTPASHNGIRILPMPKNLSLLSLLFWSIKNIKILTSANVFHSHDYFPRHLKRIFSKKYWVHTFHGYEGWPLEDSAVKSRQEVASLVDDYFCVGSFIGKWYGTDCKNVIWGAAEDPPPNLPEPDYEAVFLGRLEEDTGFKSYLEGFCLYAKKNRSAKLLVAGFGSLRDWGENFVRENHLQTKFIGPVEHPYEVIARGRVALVSGYLTIIEAGRLNKQVVAYYGTPIKKDYLECHPAVKCLRIVNSPDEIAEELEKTVIASGNEELYSWATEQTWDKIASIYESSYNRSHA